jgi:hypothetical protein
MTDTEQRLTTWLQHATPEPPRLLSAEQIFRATDDDPIPVRRAQWRRLPTLATAIIVAIIAVVAATLAWSGRGNVAGPAAATNSAGAHHAHSCPPDEKCPAPQPPPTTITLTIDGKRYRESPGTVVAGLRPFTVRAGERVTIALRLQTTAHTQLGDVWLTVNSYPSGNNQGHPSGKYFPLIHHAGVLGRAQVLSTSWTGTALFNSRALDLTILFRVGNFTVGSIIAQFKITN